MRGLWFVRISLIFKREAARRKWWGLGIVGVVDESWHFIGYAFLEHLNWIEHHRPECAPSGI